MTPQELKNSILLSAMQGRLVNQHREEGTGFSFLEEIKRERQKKGLKNNNYLEEIKTSDYLFDIPESWVWTRFGSVVEYYMGKTPPRAEPEWWMPEFPWVSISDMPESGKIIRTKEKVSLDAVRIKMGNRVSKAGTLLMSFKLTVGRVSILDIDAVHNEAIISIYPNADSNGVFQSYLFHILPYIANQGDAKDAIKGRTLNDRSICNLLIPLPPLAEQKRIVAKIEELMPLVEQYEKAYNRLEQLNKQFPDDMKKSILQLAIQGKLVEQKAEEGTGEELYKQIQAEKARLIKEGKLKKEKPLPPISEDEIPFDIPESWKWIRLGDVVEIARGGSPRPIKEYITQRPDGLNWIKIGDSVKGSKYINSTSEKILPSGLHKTRLVHKGDFILSNSMSFGRPYILNIDGCIHDGWLVIHQYFSLFDKDYLFYLLSSPMVFKQFCDRVAGAVVNNLNSDKVALTLVPIISLAEQKRIVAKIEELLPLCDLLKEKRN